jgi:hypothetical protein
VNRKKNAYLILCVLGAALPYSQFIPWLLENGFNAPLFVHQLFANRISTFFGLDVLVSAVVVVGFCTHGEQTARRASHLAPHSRSLDGRRFVRPSVVPLSPRTRALKKRQVRRRKPDSIRFAAGWQSNKKRAPRSSRSARTIKSSRRGLTSLFSDPFFRPSSAFSSSLVSSSNEAEDRRQRQSSTLTFIYEWSVEESSKFAMKKHPATAGRPLSSILRASKWSVPHASRALQWRDIPRRDPCRWARRPACTGSALPR